MVKADDTRLLAGSGEELRVAISCVDEFFHKRRLKASTKKSRVMRLCEVMLAMLCAQG